MTEPRTGGDVPTVPNTARIYDFLLGGTANYEVDRAFAAELLAKFPGTVEVLKANREFLAYAVLRAVEAGVVQLLDIGSGLPTTGNTHQIAAAATEAAVRVVYVDNDPVVVAHASALLADGWPGVHAIEGDAAEVAAVLAAAAALPEAGRLNLAEPVALILGCVLHFVPGPLGEILGAYLDALAPGSILIMTHGTGEPEVLAEAARQYGEAGISVAMRSAGEIEDALAGWHVRAPGLARVEEITAKGASADTAPGWLAAVIADKPHT